MKDEQPKITASYGMTANFGNKFEFERIDCSLTLPLEDVFEVQFDMMFRQVKMKVLEKGGKFGEQVREGTIKQVKERIDSNFEKAEELLVTEEMHQDLTNVTVLGTRGEAYVIYKNGYSTYLGKSTVDGVLKAGDKIDVKLIPKFQWLVTKHKIDWKKGLLKIDGEEG